MATKYMDASLLRIGDVILSRPKHPASKFIAYATRGKYSHAALYVRDYQVFEATTDGIGFSSLKPVRAELLPGKSPRILCSMDGYKHISLFRCPTALRNQPGNNDDNLTLAIFPLLFSLNGIEYKKLVGFNGVNTRFNWISESVRTKLLKVGGAIARDGKKLISEEFFCSELVVHVLTKLGLPVLKHPAQCPNEITPNDLSKPVVSNLEEISDFVCSPDQLATEAPMYVLDTAKMQAKFLISDKRVVKLTKELTKLTEDILVEMRESIGKRRK